MDMYIPVCSYKSELVVVIDMASSFVMAIAVTNCAQPLCTDIPHFAHGHF